MFVPGKSLTNLLVQEQNSVNPQLQRVQDSGDLLISNNIQEQVQSTARIMIYQAICLDESGTMPKLLTWKSAVYNFMAAIH